MDIAMMKQIRFTPKVQEERTFSESSSESSKVDRESFSHWLQQNQSPASEVNSKRSDHAHQNSNKSSRQQTKTIDQTREALTEKDIKNLTKKLVSLQDESLEQIDLTALMIMMDEDQLTKLMEMLDESFPETIMMLTELMNLFQEIEMTDELPEPQTLKKLVELISVDLKKVSENSDLNELDSELKDFLHALADQLKKIQEQLATENLDKEKLLTPLINDVMKKTESKDVSKSMGKVQGDEKTDESLSLEEKVNASKTEQIVNADAGMQQDKEHSDSESKNEFLSMAEKVQVQSDTKADAEIIMPFQQIEALLEKNYQLTEEIKMEKSEIQHRVMDDLVTKINMLHEKGESRIHMQLIPEHLGKLTIQLTSQDGNMTARIFAETAYARDMIENNFGQLKDALSGKGINITQLEVFVGKDPEAYEKQREFQYQMNKDKRRRGLSSEEGTSGQLVGQINPTAINHNPYLSTEGFDQLG